MLANRTTKWSAGTALACAVLIVAAWFGLVSPRRSDAADLRQQQVSAERANDLLRAKLQQLRAQYAQLPRTQAELAELHAQLTPTADLPALVRSLSGLATAAGAQLQSITPGVAALAGGPGGAAGAAGASGSAAGGASGGASGAVSGGSAGGSATGPAARSGLVTIPLSLVVSGDYYQVVGFVRGLQTQLPRAVLISGLQIDQDSAGVADGVRLSLTGQVFALPDVAGTAAARGTASSGGSGAAGGAASSGGSGSSGGSASGAGAGAGSA